MVSCVRRLAFSCQDLAGWLTSARTPIVAAVSRRAPHAARHEPSRVAASERPRRRTTATK